MQNNGEFTFRRDVPRSLVLCKLRMSKTATFTINEGSFDLLNANILQKRNRFHFHKASDP